MSHAKIGLKYQKLSEILASKNFVELRFCQTLRYKNGHNSLNFEDTGLGTHISHTNLILLQENFKFWKQG